MKTTPFMTNRTVPTVLIDILSKAFDSYIPSVVSRLLASHTIAALLCLSIFVGITADLYAGKIIRPWRSTTAIVEQGKKFEVWFDADSGQTVNSVKLKSDFLTVNTSFTVLNGNWEYDHLSKNRYDRRITVTVPSSAPADRYELILKTSNGDENSTGAVKVIQEYRDEFFIIGTSCAHRWQGGYDGEHTLRKVSEILKIADIMDVQFFFEAGDNMYNVRNNPEREVSYFHGIPNKGILGVHDIMAATFMTAGNHEAPSNSVKSSDTSESLAEFYNDYYGLYRHNTIYGNARFCVANNGWGSKGDLTGQANRTKDWLDDNGWGNIVVNVMHIKGGASQSFYNKVPFDLSLVGHNHFVANENPHMLGNAPQYVADSVRDLGNFEFNLFKIKSNGTFSLPSGSDSRCQVVQGDSKDLIADPDRWIPNLELDFSKSNNGSRSDNSATIKNRYDFKIEDAKIRFVMAKGANYTINRGTIRQQFDGDSVRVVDVAVDVNANSNLTVSISTGGTPPPPPPSSDPVVSFDTPSGHIAIDEGDDLYVKVNASDPDGISRVRLYKDGVELARSEGGAPYEWNASNQNDPELKNLTSSFTLTARATDNAGDVGEASINVTVVGAPPPSDIPLVSFHTPSGNISINEGEDLYVKVNATDLDGIDRVRLYKDGVELGRSEGGAPYEWGASGQNDPEISNLEAGSFVLTVRATDNVGEVGEASITVEVVGSGPPAGAPDVSFHTPSGNTTLNEGDDLYVKVNASDPDGINRVRLYKDGVELNRSEGSAPYEWGASNQNDPEISNLSAGSYLLTVRATDSAGDVGEASITITVNGAPASTDDPIVSFSSPSSGQSLSAGDDLYVKIDASDPDGISRVRLYKDGVELNRSEGLAPYEWGAAGQNDPEISNLSSGSFLLTARATDKNGNVGEASMTITVGGSSAPPPPPPSGGDNDSMFITWDAPNSVNAGESFTVQVSWLNTGSSTWSSSGDYKSGSMGPRDNNIWGVNRAYLDPDAIIGPGEMSTIDVNCKAPSIPGLYNFQRQLVQERIEWFGEASPVQVIEVK